MIHDGEKLLDDDCHLDPGEEWLAHERSFSSLWNESYTWVTHYHHCSLAHSDIDNAHNVATDDTDGQVDFLQSEYEPEHNVHGAFALRKKVVTSECDVGHLRGCVEGNLDLLRPQAFALEDIQSCSHQNRTLSVHIDKHVPSNYRRSCLRQQTHACEMKKKSKTIQFSSCISLMCYQDRRTVFSETEGN